MLYQMNAGAVRRFAKTMKLGAWLQTVPNKLTPPPFRLMQIGSAFWQSRALYVAARLDIATVLGDKELDADAIATRVSAKADATGRLLRLLAAIGVFEEKAPHVFRNNKISAFLRTDNPKNVRAMILMHNSDAMSRPWYEHLEQGVREGVPPFRLAHGEDLFDYLDHHADLDFLFSEAMDSVEALTGDSFATDFDWGRFERIIDVGGSRGTKSLAILKRHPKLTALVVDRPQVIAEAKQYWAVQNTSGIERLRFQAGDALNTIPLAQSERDIYLLSAVLHGFDDETCITVLRNVANACGQTGARIALLEMVLPEVGADVAGASFDMQMFMGSRGRERTLKEWTALFDDSGMVLEEVVGLQSFGNILVLLPKK
jgi:O-methyltransferase/methyltransferase family protein